MSRTEHATELHRQQSAAPFLRCQPELKLSRFTFHETDTLSSDLTRLLQAQHTGPIACDSTNNAAACGTAADFPGIILLYDQCPCAAIGYKREPCKTIGISEPIVLQEATDDVYRALFGQLIRAIKRRAASEGVRRLQVLLPASADGQVSWRLLTEHGFLHAAEILQWDFSAAACDRCTPPDRYTIQIYDFAANNAAAYSEILSVLDAILECSEDLRSLPQPTAIELLTRWHFMQAQVFVCRMDDEIAGLIACVTSPILSMAATVSETAAPSDTNICIEYIGVVPVFRRRQIATLMLRQIPALATSIHGADNLRSEICETPHSPDGKDGIRLQALRVTTYSDAVNTPANSLYQRCGFMQTIRRHLWCCDLAKET